MRIDQAMTILKLSTTEKFSTKESFILSVEQAEKIYTKRLTVAEDTKKNPFQFDPAWKSLQGDDLIKKIAQAKSDLMTAKETLTAEENMDEIQKNYLKETKDSVMKKFTVGNQKNKAEITAYLATLQEQEPKGPVPPISPSATFHQSTTSSSSSPVVIDTFYP